MTFSPPADGQAGRADRAGHGADGDPAGRVARRDGRGDWAGQGADLA
jgi:hypothetical protein